MSPLASSSSELSRSLATSTINHENSTSHATEVASVETEAERRRNLQINVPYVKITQESISSAMAARLATSLLCHVLFLKSQIPFPVAQLSRIPGGQSNSKAGKKREELMNTIDTLSSHLQTTFTALSTAYAFRQGRQETSDGLQNPTKKKAHIAFVLGPSVGAAKARVMLSLDGLEVKLWDTGAEDNLALGSISDAGESDSDRNESSSSSSESESEHEQEHNNETDDSASLPPPSRSPSPLSRPSSPLMSVLNTPPISAPFRVATSPQPPTGIEKSPPKAVKPAFTILSENAPPSAPPRRRPLSVLGSSTLKASSQPLVPSSRIHGENAPPRPCPVESISAPLACLSLSEKSGPRMTRQPLQSHDEEQQVLRAADRLLSRTLANACAEADGGLSDELAPTQTHVFLRAPRCFSHSAWVPRQNLTRTLDVQLQTFLDEAISEPPSDSAPPSKKKALRQGVKTEGVWIAGAKTSLERSQTINTDEPVHEDDEMIWWVWDGKIVGFGEW